MKSFLPSYSFNKGLQTRKNENFSSPDEFTVFQNVRVKSNAARRPGTDRLAIASGGDSGAMNFNGTDQYVAVSFDARVWTLPLRFSLRLVINQDDAPAGTECILGWDKNNGPVFVKINSSGKLVFTITDSASSSTTVTSASSITPGTKYTILITRDTSSLKMWINNTLDATGTMSATLSGKTPTQDMVFGCNGVAGLGGATEHFDGTLDHVLLMNSVLSDNSEGFLRPIDPRADDIWAYYPMETAGYNKIEDLSKFENFAVYVPANMPTPVSSLCVQDEAILGMMQFSDITRKKLFVVAGRTFYNPDLV